MTAAQTIVWEFDTAVWWQQLARDEDGFVLTRTYRDATRDRASQAVTPPVAPSGQVHLVWTSASTSSDSQRCSLRGDEQLATQLWPQVAPAFLPGGAGLSTMTDLGRLLATLHRSAPPPIGDVSPHVERLRRYLAEPAGPAAAAVGWLSPKAVARLQSVADAAAERGTAVLCHGGFSLGSVVADSDHTFVEVVIGPEICSGSPELDLGWMVGELTEFEFTARANGCDHPDAYPRAAEALIAGYSSESDRVLDQAVLGAVAAARIALHMIDFSVTTASTAHCATLAPFVTWLLERGQPPAEHQHQATDGTPP
ncbi:phosphotransferase [Williamsia soli]|uniref:phosphotransferase n=1 Tax=Williamsia soli TaxID=364929 RepID=UPI001A9F9E19|nr:phosphotransferase [Williamsia soli]